MNQRTILTKVASVRYKQVTNKTHRVIAVDLNLVPGWKKSVESHDELWMTSEEAGHSRNDSRGVDALALELLHDVEEVVVHLRLVPELELDLVQVGECVFDLEALEVGVV